MKYDPLKHHRRSIRLGGYDYAAPGAYFVTIVARGRECLLGEVTAEWAVRLNEMGETVKAEWEALPRRFPRARLDAYVVMPNHLHGIIVVGRGEASATDGLVITARPEADASPLRAHGFQRTRGTQRAHGTRRGSLAAMVQNFKAVSTRRLNGLRGTAGDSFWQRNYWEHVVRSAADLARIRSYIETNPARWTVDQLNPAAVGQRKDGS